MNLFDLFAAPSWARAIRLVGAVVALSAPVHAQDSARSPATKFVIRSAKLGENRTFYVVPPHDYPTNTARHPVLVLMDAEDQFQFAAAVANIEFLASRGEIPSLIVVGITNGKDRTHDLTPRPRGRTVREYGTSGGAALTASYIRDEVLPMVRDKYRTLPSVILAGHSFGGLFALHVAAAMPEAFAGVIAMSPALWWNEGSAVNAYADSIAKSATPLRLVVTSGGLERAIDSVTTRFVARFETIKPATIGFTSRRYLNDDHALTPAQSLVDGLRFIFEPISLSRAAVLGVKVGDSTSVMNAFVATQQSYARAARDLRLPESLPEMFVNTIGYATMRELKLPRTAVGLFRLNVANYPESPNVYDSLGDALLAIGDRREARTQFQRAVDAATRNKLPVDPATRKKLATLDRELGPVKARPK